MGHYIIFVSDTAVNNDPNTLTGPVDAWIVESDNLDNAFKFASNKYSFPSGNYRIDKLNVDDKHIRGVAVNVTSRVITVVDP